MKTKTITTERYEICSLCGGRGQEYAVPNIGTTTSNTMTCRQCSGSGRRMIERTVIVEETDTV